MTVRFITPYAPQWPALFEQIRNCLYPCLPTGCVIHHVGSTSIPEMPAKAIIDLDIECPIGAMARVIETLRIAGYEHRGDLGIMSREAFKPIPETRPASLPLHHLYACESSSPELRKHLAFKNYLIARPDRAAWLARQKTLADEMAATRDKYIENKAAAYAIITAESMEWSGASNERPR